MARLLPLAVAAFLGGVRGVRQLADEKGVITLAADSSLTHDFLDNHQQAFAAVEVEPAALKAAQADNVEQLLMGVVPAANGKPPALRVSMKGAEKDTEVAWASWNNTIPTTGWAYLKVGTTGSEKVTADLRMYAAGYLEGLVSAEEISHFYNNARKGLLKDEEKHHALKNIQALFGREIAYLQQQSGLYANRSLSTATEPKDAWWRQARFIFLQTWGILDAVNSRAKEIGREPISMVDFLIMNGDGETPEMMMAYDMQEYLLRESEHDGGDKDDAPDDGSSTPGAFLQRSENRQRQRIMQRGKLAATAAAKTHALTRSRIWRRTARARADARRRKEMEEMDDDAWRKIQRASGHCSALVRLAPGEKDLFLGHTTFSDYGEALRVFKFYDFPNLGKDVAGKVSFSSYPGVAGSTDDWYLLPESGLAVTETTLSMLTDEPYDNLNDNGTTAPDFLRIMVANRLARSGKDWADLMVKSSTGMYSSQWMVVDYNKFEAGKPLKNGTLFVLEQVPGKNHGEDMTWKLQKDGYWASYNRPWFMEVRDAIGATTAEELHGDLFSRDRNPRAHIFQHTANKVVTLNDMRQEMQSNRWPNEVDGGIQNTPDHAIAARGDLDRKDPAPNGAVDSKVTSACLFKKMQTDAISGPTHEGQKVFRWKDEKGRELYPDYPHEGLPNVWNFDWVRMTPDQGEVLKVPVEGDC